MTTGSARPTRDGSNDCAALIKLIDSPWNANDCQLAPTTK